MERNGRNFIRLMSQNTWNRDQVAYNCNVSRQYVDDCIASYERARSYAKV